MLRLLVSSLLGLSLALSVSAAPIGKGSPVTPKLYQVGQLIKCSYKGRFASTKTVECQLRAGLNTNNIWKFSAAENHWSALEENAGQQVMLGYREGGIKHMEADFSLLNLKTIHANTSKKMTCGTSAPTDSYSVGFRVARILSAEDKGGRWVVNAQLGGNGNIEAWTFELDQKENSACYEKFLDLMGRGESNIFHYHQEGKNDEYKIWQIN